MGSLVVVIAWVLIRYLLADNDLGPSVTSLNLTDPPADPANANASSAQTVSTEAIPEESLDSFVETYYRNRPITDDVVKFLRSFLTTGCHAVPEGSVELLVYFFARIAKDRTDLIRLYERELSEVTGRGADVLLEILRQAADRRTKGFLESCLRDDSYSSIHRSIAKALDVPFPEFQSALLRPVRSGIDLDLLWIEFLATGSKEPVSKIIDVLNRPDLVRERVQESLNVPGSRFRQWQAFRRIRKLPETFELRFDGRRKQVRTIEDLDCQLGLDGVQTNSKRAERIRSLLPVKFSTEELHYIAVKSMAKWSVASNASKHPIVLEACAEAEARTPGAQLCLLEVQAEAYRLRWQPADAQRVLAEYLRLNPESRVIARKRADAAAGIISIPRSDAKTVALSDRPGTFAAAFLGIFLLALGDAAFAAITHLLEWSFWIATISGLICLVLAIGIGALRQIYNGLLERAVAIPTDRGPVYLGIVPPSFWFSVPVRAASWLVAGALSIWASWVLAIAVLRSSLAEFLLWTGAVLLIRFGISLGLTRAFFAYRRSIK